MHQETFKRHIKNHREHWWFQARKEIIRILLKKNLKTKTNKLLDFGSGSGVNIDMLQEFGKIFVFEKDHQTYKFLKKNYKKNKNAKILKSLNHNNKFDVILAADVIEHIKDDKKIINYLSNKLKKNGLLLITVPAYSFLYSNKDKALKHFRRYSKFSLKKLIASKFNISKISYFNFFLFLPISISIIFYKILNLNFINSAESTPNFIINKILYFIFKSEILLLNKFDLPFGISLVCIAKRK